MTTNHSNQPLHGTSEQDRARLGILLQRRRSELGYGTNGLRRFARERGASWRAFYDIEKAARDGFMVAKLDEFARAYEVTYDSLVAVGRGEAVELDVARPGEAVELVLADDPSGEHLQEASIEKARAKLGDIIDHVRYTGDPVLITRHGTPAVLVTPLLGRSDYGSIDAARRLDLDANDARYVVEDLLYMLDRYLAADKNLDGGHGQTPDLRV